MIDSLINRMSTRFTFSKKQLSFKNKPRNIKVMPPNIKEIVCVFVCFNGRPGKQIEIATPRREHPISWDIAHIQKQKFLYPTPHCTSSSGLRGRDLGGRNFTEAGGVEKTHKCQKPTPNRYLNLLV